MGVMLTPLSRGGALECEVAGPKDSFGGCVSGHVRQHTPPPSQEGNRTAQALNNILHCLSITKHFK
jgi:hypothetical protein